MPAFDHDVFDPNVFDEEVFDSIVMLWTQLARDIEAWTTIPNETPEGERGP